MNPLQKFQHQLSRLNGNYKINKNLPQQQFISIREYRSKSQTEKILHQSSQAQDKSQLDYCQNLNQIAYISLNFDLMPSEPISQALFLSVKEKLDYHRLPTIFPFEATPLLAKIFSKIEGSRSAPYPHPSSQPHQDSVCDAALRQEMGRVLMENSKLHMDLIVSKEQIQSLRHQIDKSAINKCKSEGAILLEMKQTREKELAEEVRQLRFKYNQLLDLIHQDNTFERKYLKRLIKHNHIETEIPKSKQPEKHQFQHQTKQNVEQTVPQSDQNLLLDKIANRQAEILRLQKKLQYGGLNMNKVLKDFNDDQTKSKLATAQMKISLLEDKTGQLQNVSRKLQNGSKEALREEVQKCHAKIKGLSQQNKALRRKEKELQFDSGRHDADTNRKMLKSAEDVGKMKSELQKKEFIVQDLEKKNQFLVKEGDTLRQEIKSCRKKIEQKQNEIMDCIRLSESKLMQCEYNFGGIHQKKEEQIEQLKERLRTTCEQIAFLRREDSLKTQAIQNLERIVDELMRKEDNGETLELNRSIITLRAELLRLQQQRERDTQQRESRSGVLLKENQAITNQLSLTNKELIEKNEIICSYQRELEELRTLVRTEQFELQKAGNKATELALANQRLTTDFKLLNERFFGAQKIGRQRIRELQMKLSGQEEVVQVRTCKLEEKSLRVRECDEQIRKLSDGLRVTKGQLTILEDRSHEVAKEKHRLQRKYEELLKECEYIKQESTKREELIAKSIDNQTSILKREITRLTEVNEKLSSKQDELAECIALLRRSKEVSGMEFEVLSSQNRHLKQRIQELQYLDRNCNIEAESKRRP